MVRLFQGKTNVGFLKKIQLFMNHSIRKYYRKTGLSNQL